MGARPALAIALVVAVSWSWHLECVEAIPARGSFAVTIDGKEYVLEPEGAFSYTHSPLKRTSLVFLTVH
jgi:hypothetical protein